jgi:biotin synthase
MNTIKSKTNTSICNDSNIRHDWSRQEILALYNTPLNDLLFEAHTLHRQYFDPNTIQLSTLLNIKSGGCSEDCAYCSQSARHKTAVEAETMMPVLEAVKMAKQAKENGASRFCMGAAWRQPNEQDLGEVINMVHEIKALGLETCATLGMLDREQALKLKKAGLDYYNHNLDTSAAFYKSIISTHDYEDRLDTLGHVRDAGINVCCGGIIGMGESEHDRADMLQTLACMPKHPESVPINLLIKVEGTPLSGVDLPDTFEFIRMIAVARILMPASFVRLSAGREQMTDEMQAMCFFAGANAIFFGENLLTTDNPTIEHDRALFRRLGLKAQT